LATAASQAGTHTPLAHPLSSGQVESSTPLQSTIECRSAEQDDAQLPPAPELSAKERVVVLTAVAAPPCPPGPLESPVAAPPTPAPVPLAEQTTTMEREGRRIRKVEGRCIGRSLIGVEDSRDPTTGRMAKGIERGARYSRARRSEPSLHVSAPR